MNGTAIDWAFRIGAGIAALAATLILAWSLFADRSRGRRRCPRCWYAMDAVTPTTDHPDALRCPECGHAAHAEHALFRTRRHWRWVPLAALLGLTTYSLAIAPSVRANGWPSAIPSTVLVAAWPGPVSDWVSKHIDDNVITNPLVEEIDARIDGYYWSPSSCFPSSRPARVITPWQLELWHDRVIAELRDEGRYDIQRERPIVRKLSATRLTRSIDAERLEDAFRILAKDLDVAITPDWKGLQENDISPDKLVSLSLVSATGGDALSNLLRAAGVSRMSPVVWHVEPSGVVVGPWDPDSTNIPVVSYGLATFVTAADALWHEDGRTPSVENRVQILVHAIGANIEPESWVNGGGDLASYTILGNNMIVRAPANFHVAIEDFLAKFRGAINNTDHDTPWKETAAIHARLARTTMPRPTGPVSLASVVQSIRTLTDIPVDPNWPGLAALHVLPDLQVDLTFSSPAPTLVEILDTLVAALVPDTLDGVDWTIHTGALRIGPAEDFADLQITRVYNTSRIASDAHAVAAALQRGVDPDDWYDAGGDKIGDTGIGPLLCIRTTARRHARIAKLLDNPDALAALLPPPDAAAEPVTAPDASDPAPPR